jgi:hypothetical protein
MRDGVGLSGRVPRLRRQPMADLRTVGVQLVSPGEPLAAVDPSTGDCRDGLHIDRVNQNQGTRKGIPRSCGASKARAINLYYGAADTSGALATGSVGQLLDWLDRHGTPCNHAIAS